MIRYDIVWHYIVPDSITLHVYILQWFSFSQFMILCDTIIYFYIFRGRFSGNFLSDHWAQNHGISWGSPEIGMILPYSWDGSQTSCTAIDGEIFLCFSELLNMQKPCLRKRFLSAMRSKWNHESLPGTDQMVRITRDSCEHPISFSTISMRMMGWNQPQNIHWMTMNQQCNVE